MTESTGSGIKRCKLLYLMCFRNLLILTVSLRRSIVGSIKRSLSPLSKKSGSLLSSQHSCGSAEVAQDSSSFAKAQLVQANVSSSPSRFTKSNSISPDSSGFIETVEDELSLKNQYDSNDASPGTSKTSKSSPFSSKNRRFVQSMHDIPSPKKTISTVAISTANRLRKSLSTSFHIDHQQFLQVLGDNPAQDNHPFLPARSLSSSSKRHSENFLSRSINSKNRFSVHSIQELPSPENDISHPARGSSVSAGGPIGVLPSPTSEQSTPLTKRSSVVSFQIPENVQVESPQSELLFAAQTPSNANKSNRSSWFSVSRTSSTRSRKQYHLATLKRLGRGAGREASSFQRKHYANTAKHTTLPWDPPLNRDWDLKAIDGIPSHPDELFEHSLPRRLNNSSSALFDLPINIRRQIYSCCLLDKENITVSLSPHFATKNCFQAYYFTSPWDILRPVAGGLVSFQLLRDDLMTYFWTEYTFHFTLTPFCNAVFTPLSSVWMPTYLDRIQHLAIEIDLTRFGGSALRTARQFGYNMEKMEHLLLDVVNGLVARRGQMAELIVLCRRFDGIRLVDETDPSWIEEESHGKLAFFHNLYASFCSSLITTAEYFPRESMKFCNALVNLRGIVKSVRIAGFPLDLTKTLLKTMFGRTESLQFIILDDTAWPPTPEVYSGLRRAPELYATSMAPTSSGIPDHQENPNNQWKYEESVYSPERLDINDDSPVRSGTSHSVTTIGDHVQLYQDLLPPMSPLEGIQGNSEYLPVSIETPTRNATVTYQVMAAEDRNNSKRHNKKPNPRNSRDFSPGQFYNQQVYEPASELSSQGGNSTTDPDPMKSVLHASNTKGLKKRANHAEVRLSGSSSNRRGSNERDKPLPKTPNPSSRRKSQFDERQMPDIPESPLKFTLTQPQTPIPEIIPGTLKAKSDAHLRRIRSHITKSESTASSDEQKLLSQSSGQNSKPKISGSDNDISLVRTPSRKPRSEVQKECNGSSLTLSSHISSNDNQQQLANGCFIDRGLLRTPSPTAREMAEPALSPNTLNKINEQDPKFLKSIRALQTASNSSENLIKDPTKSDRPNSLVGPSTDKKLRHSAPQRSFTSTDAHSIHNEQSDASGTGSLRLRGVLTMFSRRSR